MDKNSVIGLVLIAGILLAYNFFTAPSADEIQQQKYTQDSIAYVQEQTRNLEIEAEKAAPVVVAENPELNTQLDSLVHLQNIQKFGTLVKHATGEEKLITVENEKWRIVFNSKGGKPVKIELKEYSAYDSTAIQLFEEKTAEFGLGFLLSNQLEINSENLYFLSNKTENINLIGEENAELRFTVYTDDKQGQLNLIYRFTGNSYEVDFDVETRNFPMSSQNPILFNWNITGLSQEKGRQIEMQKASVFFKYLDRDRDYISESSEDNLDFERKANWIAFKQNFFSAIIISDVGFTPDASSISIEPLENLSVTKRYGAKLQLPFENIENDRVKLKFFFGPNKFKTLSDMGRDLDRVIDFGWGIFGWVNKYLVIPIFNVLGKLNWNYGIIILILTVIIKSMLFPFTYKNYKSSAKMRVLKPEIDKLNEKHKNSDPMAKQQAMMALYKETGVNPMAGCLPMVLQMPILYAMFRFFPSSIELRHESFLWADDLSSYDSIYELPWDVPMYGDHISLLTILMCASTLVYTRMNSGNMPQQQAGMPNMKVIMYIFPVMMLFFFNNFASGLSLYYFTANMITMSQMFVIKKYIISEDKILAQIQDKKNTPSKKSRLQLKMEEMTKKQGVKGIKK
ncbi:MAG: YidC/Oxa1 family membrane protein insertase [Luteibaculaceae bacterium]|jgi:YidC/Oxa1 family membrane protein insertase